MAELPDLGIRIRKESAADIAAIRALHQASFPTPVEAALVDALRVAGRLSISLVAVVDQHLIGYLAFSPITVDEAPTGLGLAPVAVRSDWRRRGAAARLIHDGLALRHEARTAFVVVLGEPRYYCRFGFVPGERLGLRSEYQAGDAFQALCLVRGAAPAEGGLVRYCSEFAALGV